MSVVFKWSTSVPLEEMQRNTEHTKTLNLPSVEYAGPVAVVGGGLSLADHLDELRAWKGPIWAINGAWRWLKQRGIEATFFTVDPKPQPWLAEHRPKAALIATVGSPELFASLSHSYVRTFRLAVDEVNCGVTSATAAPHLAILMGHHSLTFFGCDSSFGNYKTHVYEVPVPGDLIAVTCGGRAFATKPEFVLQAEELSSMCRQLPKQCRNRSGGLLAALIANPEWDIASTEEAA